MRQFAAPKRFKPRSARLESLAEPGGVALSAAVHAHVEGKLEGTFRFEGEKTVKNIAKPVPVYTLVTDAADASDAAAPAPIERTETELPSIAVLSFENMGGDPEQDYCADGLAEDLITELARFQELRVVARNSSFAYKGKATNVRQVGEELGVRYVLEGSVRKAGNRVRITAQLIEAASDKHLWAERYDRDMDDLFAVQDEVNQRIVATLAPTLEASERKRARILDRCENLQAYDAVLCAHEKWSKFNEADNLEARKLYQQAIDLDPDYARAYSGKRYEEARNILETVVGLTFAQRILAMTYAQMCATQKAQSMAKRFLERYPDFSTAVHMDSMNLTREEDRVHYAEGLEKAGFPA